MENDSAAQRCMADDCLREADENCPLGLCTVCWWWAADSLAEHQRATRPRSQRRGVIYFVQVGDRIKIGFTTQPKQRMKAYPPGSTVLAWRDGVLPIDEKELHDRFTQYRVAGREWYRDADELRDFIAEMVATYGQPPAWLQPKWGTGQKRQAHYMGRGRPAMVANSKPWLT